MLFLAMPSMAIEQTFRFEDAAASKVEIAGEFNEWKAAEMQRDSSGVWTLTLDIPAGTYGYKFLVNGEVWTFDPANSARKTVEGNENSSVTVGDDSAASAQSSPKQWTFSYSDPSAQAVFVAGSFNGWSTTAHPLSKNDAGVWTATVSLPPGETTYKFIVDGEWRIDPANSQVVEDGLGGSNSAITVEGP